MRKILTWISLTFGFKYYPYITALEDALKYKDDLIVSLSDSEDRLCEELDQCQHLNTSESHNSIKLKEAMEALLLAIDGLPPLTAIEGTLTKEVADAKTVIKQVENSWGWHDQIKKDS